MVLSELGKEELAAQRKEKRFFERRPKTSQEKQAAVKKEARSKWNERWNTMAAMREQHGNPQVCSRAKSQHVN